MNSDEIFKALSAIFSILDILSAILIADFTVRHRHYFDLNVILRGLLAFMAVGLLAHAAEQVQILQNYTPPRSRSWILIFTGLHATIFAAWFRSLSKKEKQNAIIDTR